MTTRHKEPDPAAKVAATNPHKKNNGLDTSAKKSVQTAKETTK
ncbi:hypothetical protein QFZ30_002445 [Arthrobacter pascens]|nr:hypothetical protein [Arthrobacter pascens]MDQ0679063.1 hypothetical protein [Arthrobacter pascens]